MKGKKPNYFPAVWVAVLIVFILASPPWGPVTSGTGGVLTRLVWGAVGYCTGGVLTVLLVALIGRGQTSRKDRVQPGFWRRCFLTMLKVFALWPGVIMMAAFFLFFRIMSRPAVYVAMVLAFILACCTWDALPSGTGGGLTLLVRVAVTYCTGGVLTALLTAPFFWSELYGGRTDQPGFWRHYSLTMLTVFALWPGGIMMAALCLSIMITAWYQGRP